MLYNPGMIRNPTLRKVIKYIFEGIGVIFILLRPDGTVLMQQRDERCRRYPHTWCFPGGGSEKGESFKQTAIREIKEEYNLEVEEGNLVILMSRYLGRQKVYLYKVSQDVNPVMAEGAAMKWMGIDEIKKLKLGFEQGNIVGKLEKYLSKLPNLQVK